MPSAIRRHRLRVPTAVAVLALLSGCGGEDIGEEAVRRYSVADTSVVENLWPEIADTLRPSEVARYGRAEGDPDYLFSEIYAFAVDESGRVFVHDSDEGIRVFSREGAFLGRAARNGEGPSEVGYVVGMAVRHDGGVVSMDLRNRRVSVLGMDRAPWSTRMPEGRPPYRDGVVVVMDDGRLFVGYNPLYPEDGSGIEHPRPIFIRVTDDGALADTVYTPEWVSYHCPELSSRRHSAGFWHDNREPYAPKVKWALGADGTLAVGCSATYTFYLIGPEGDVVRVARARARIEMSDEERAFRAAMPVVQAERVMPAYARIRLPGDGRIWVWPTQPNVKIPLPPEVADQFGVTHTWSIPWQGAFDVFDETGRWLAVVELPARARYSGFPTEPGVVIRGDTLWAVEQDEYDVQTIVRYLVPGLSPGSP